MPNSTKRDRAVKICCQMWLHDTGRTCMVLRGMQKVADISAACLRAITCAKGKGIHAAMWKQRTRMERVGQLRKARSVPTVGRVEIPRLGGGTLFGLTLSGRLRRSRWERISMSLFRSAIAACRSGRLYTTVTSAGNSRTLCCAVTAPVAGDEPPCGGDGGGACGGSDAPPGCAAGSPGGPAAAAGPILSSSSAPVGVGTGSAKLCLWVGFPGSAVEVGGAVSAVTSAWRICLKACGK